ncbi:MAG: hypothetical protein HY866_20080, partial [Chloroflexi bacterium]|nr:hypothetical protein [Chloroflexota bacterium]
MYSRTRFLELKVNLVCSNSAAANRTRLTLSIDGVDQEVLWDQASPVANYRQMCCLNVVIDLGANFNTFHTLKLRWQPTAGTSTIYGVAGEVAPKMWIRELMEEKYY